MSGEHIVIKNEEQEPTRVNEWNEVVHRSVGFQRGETISYLPKEENIRLNLATVTKMNEDGTFTHTLPEEDIDAEHPSYILIRGFKDKLKEEIARLDEDMQEIDEEIDGLSESRKEMYEKQGRFREMLKHYTEFTDKYSDTLL